MRTVAFAIALLMGGTALAQTSTTGSGDMATTQSQPASGPGTAGYTGQSQTTDTNAQPATVTDTSSDQATATTQTGWNTSSQTNMATNAVASTGTVVEPSNANPRRDARGIKVISMAATVPAGWNGTPSTDTGMGGPMLDPNTGQPVSDTGSYPACSRTVTDKCVQTYERRRR